MPVFKFFFSPPANEFVETIAYPDPGSHRKNLPFPPRLTESMESFKRQLLELYREDRSPVDACLIIISWFSCKERKWSSFLDISYNNSQFPLSEKTYFFS